MTRDEIRDWLKTGDESRLEELWLRADEVRRRNVGDEVHLRGLLEISNCCVRSCRYCGLRVENSEVGRYRMTEEEIMACAHQAVAFGYGTVVLQAGEDYGISRDWMAGVIRRIKGETPLAVTLSLGERSDEEFAAWRDAGADRYLLRFETSNRVLYDAIHPPLPGRHSDRFALFHTLKELGFEIGSGIMIGIPGQTYDDLAADIEIFQILDFDMIGVGPFIPHPATPLGRAEGAPITLAGEQVPNSEAMTYRVMALTRMVCPRANIPATSALATLNLAQGRELGLMRGGNVLMPNLTPQQYRAQYEIYPAKACIDETAHQCRSCMAGRINAIGRTVGSGRGDSPRRKRAA
ncbi:[FeFe] hydrogenase H-cluster radical SAM maturase HydE [Geobacter hydrogenophilus]|uniref:[FeFe] hydrogenase H-cluster radical SAM maturase HydE n=1 Tax=Geobacter hydrogenophilus TaxID=40983 RepID=A0A9W6LE43_9BACT|nr:[FeFe] hydrogenase H-cluster radical SAM maturase HydE [Geobacter hydrogenophilus]MBT0893040.1 [FeFe] hydrogenase H-cluster radical SAM maturase HydE [Geobacter hydrogenophilus]GLI39121.1 [FeFe] hydrogenase H-cluster radical SAM maturase HydE [Geobacter hydrogenophilus]